MVCLDSVKQSLFAKPGGQPACRVAMCAWPLNPAPRRLCQSCTRRVREGGQHADTRPQQPPEVNPRCLFACRAANGSLCKCTAIGDMPVLAKDSTGKIFRFVFTNVRYVPEFKYTLISVKHIFRDQSIKSLFADSNKLVFPGGNSLPYDPRFKLYAITLISEPMLINGLSAIEKSKTEANDGNT